LAGAAIPQPESLAERRVADLSARHRIPLKGRQKLAGVPNPSGSEGFGF
jgi:hypothetical protein